MPAVPDQPNVPDRYRLLGLHAEGSLGRVWRAHDSALGREVALKELRPSCAHDAEARSRFLLEAQVTSQLEHPYIVPVHEVSTAGTLFYTMTFVRGRTLEAVIAEHHAKTSGQRSGTRRFELLAIFHRVCEAVAYAHSRGVVHRDLKPSNIMLGAFGEVFVLDWGLARVQGMNHESGPRDGIELPAELSGEHTVAGRVIGTPGYMAPEQAAGRQDQIDHRSDVYALGAILFKILTGVSPHEGFAGGGVLTYLKRIIEAPVPSSRSIQPGTPPALDAICARAMEKEPARRYEGALQLAGDVRRWVEGLPTHAYREPWGQRLARWLTRHQRLAQLGALGLLAACMLSAGMIWQTWSEVRALRQVQLDQLEGHVNQVYSELTASLREVRGTTNLLAHTVRIGEYVHSLRDLDPKQREIARQRATQLLATAALNRPHCRRLALLGSADDYRELIAVEAGAAPGTVAVVPEKDLESLGKSRHFIHITEVLRAQPDRFYLSHFREWDSSTPIIMAIEHLQTDPDCWLSIRMDYRPLFERWLDHKQLDALVCDEDRHTIYANGPSQHAEELSRDPRFQSFFAGDQEILSEAMPDGDLVYARKLHYDSRERQRFLMVVLVAPYQEAVARQLTRSYLLLGVLVPTVIALLALVSFTSRYMLRARGDG